jgi:signal transduction histidine kinase
MHLPMESSAPSHGQVALERAVLDFISVFGDPGAGPSDALAILVTASGADAVILERIERDCDDTLWLVSEGQATAPGIDKVWPPFVLGTELEQTVALMAGRPWIVADGHAPECADREKYLTLDPPIRSEACFPIVIDGTTVGMLSFVIAERPHRWSRNEEELLSTAAAVVQMAWAHESARSRLDAVALDGHHSRATTEALLACSQALLLGSGDSAVEEALAAMLTAFGGTAVYVDENVEHPELGFSAETRYAAVSGERTVELEGFFELLPWNSLPEQRDRLAVGAIVSIESPDDLDPTTREIYASLGDIQAELVAPVFVHGTWKASVGLIDLEPRRWLRQQRSMLEAVAAMFAAHWERQATELELRQAIESRDAFVSSVSHELRTPLAAVVGFTNELRDSMGDFDTDTVRELLRIVAWQASEVSYIVDDLLVAARSRHAQLTLVPAAIDLHAEVLAALGSMPPEFNATVEVETEGGVTAWADSRRVRQIVRNLVVNAWKYGGPSCLIRCGTDGPWATLDVMDDGSGIPPSLQASMFDHYSSGGADPGSLPSMGLGLAVSLELTNRMGGGIEYRHDGWSTFTVRLPSAGDTVTWSPPSR